MTRPAAQVSEFGPPGASTGARHIALRALAEHARCFPDLVPRPLPTDGLDPRDAALARAIHDSVIRRWLTLRALLSPRLTMPFDEMEPKLKAVLLAGASQLLLLDKVPPHAAVSESVEWAKRHVRAKAGGLVNAVLRRVNDSIVGRACPFEDRRDQILLADGRAIDLAAPFLPEDPIERLAIQASVPPGVIRRWIDTRGAADARRAAIHSLCLPPIILNTSFAAEPVASTRPHESPGNAVFTGTPAELSELLQRRTDVWAQDPASSSTIRSVAGSASPGLIVDLCAGRGTKTRQLAHSFPHARIVACDTDRARAMDLAEVFRGHDRVQVLPPRQVLPAIAGEADLVVLDVPCSNSGVFARRPEAKYRFSRDQTRRLGDIQRQLLADAVPMLSPQGMVLYATCSLEPEEDAAPLAWAAQWHGFATQHSELVWPQGTPGGDAAHYHDGSFFALLSRR
ncbi:MAG: hypothetical protein DYG94_12085 [Leptolyngbya sp. PLA3]|nr:MAG: hypothetical protein EDM82_13625 [Cyanobacteria bacterium CYA]MCE7969464.1 hypothetical protein [Leptolyngbya sp. PL-A3]